MKFSIPKTSGPYVAAVITVIALMALVRATPETWGIKKYFQPV